MSRISRAKPHTKRRQSPKKRRRSESSTEIQSKRWPRAKKYIPRILSAGNELFINLPNTILSLRVFTTTFATYNNQIFCTSRVSAFSFYLKKKTPAKEKQNRGDSPVPPQRRAAVLSPQLSISCSAHSHANAPELERVRARASCYASRSLACLRWPSNTAARLLKARL